MPMETATGRHRPTGVGRPNPRRVHEGVQFGVGGEGGAKSRGEVCMQEAGSIGIGAGNNKVRSGRGSSDRIEL
jgi:hypothetical protein